MDKEILDLLQNGYAKERYFESKNKDLYFEEWGSSISNWDIIKNKMMLEVMDFVFTIDLNLCKISIRKNEKSKTVTIESDNFYLEFIFIE